MAITSAQMNTALGYDGNRQKPQVLRMLPPYQTVSNPPTLQYWLIHGGQPYHGKVRKTSTTASDNASTQAAAVLVTLGLTGCAP